MVLVALAPQESQELEESKSRLDAEKQAREREAQMKCAERRAKREALKSLDNAGGMAPGSAVPDSESKNKLDR